MGSIAAARRTQSSVPVYVASINPAEYQALNAYLDPAIGDSSGHYPARAAAIPGQIAARTPTAIVLRSE
jgi:hypothetical protein